MGVSLIATFQPKLPGEIAFAFPQMDGKCLARAVPLLDEICAAKGVAPFIPDVDDLADMSPEELDEAVEQREFDFDSGEGLKIVQMLIKELKTEEKWTQGRTKRERFGQERNRRSHLESGTARKRPEGCQTQESALQSVFYIVKSAHAVDPLLA